MQPLLKLRNLVEVLFVDALEHLVVTAQLRDNLEHGLLIIHGARVALLTLCVKYRGGDAMGAVCLADRALTMRRPSFLRMRLWRLPL